VLAVCIERGRPRNCVKQANPTPSWLRIGVKVSVNAADVRLDRVSLSMAAGTSKFAISISCGVDRGGLPVGVQIIGPLYEDRQVQCAAASLEDALDFVSLSRKARRPDRLELN
jgi:Asp-tRNA(Asn)/Glu-tRNA(Gln) amidotransferase A subunit family amidase